MPSCLCFPCLVSESFQSQFLDYIPFILLSRGIPLPWIFLQVKLFTFWGGESHEEETLAIPLLIILESLILIIEIRLLLPPSLLLLSKFDQFSNMKFILIQSHPNKWSLIIHSGNIDEWFSIIWWLIDIWLDYLYDWLIDIHSYSFLFNLTRINDLSSSIQSRLFLCPRFSSCCGTVYHFQM